MLTNCERLLATQQPVSGDEWRAAKARDVAESSARPMRVARLAPRRFASPAHTIAAMARLMADRAAVDGSCSLDDLRCAGFSTDDVTRYAAEAQVMAAAITRDRVLP